LKSRLGDSDFQPEHNDDNDNVYVGTIEPPLGFKKQSRGEEERGRGERERVTGIFISPPCPCSESHTYNLNLLITKGLPILNLHD